MNITKQIIFMRPQSMFIYRGKMTEGIATRYVKTYHWIEESVRVAMLQLLFHSVTEIAIGPNSYISIGVINFVWV